MVLPNSIFQGMQQGWERFENASENVAAYTPCWSVPDNNPFGRQSPASDTFTSSRPQTGPVSAPGATGNSGTDNAGTGDSLFSRIMGMEKAKVGLQAMMSIFGMWKQTFQQMLDILSPAKN